MHHAANSPNTMLSGTTTAAMPADMRMALQFFSACARFASALRFSTSFCGEASPGPVNVSR